MMMMMMVSFAVLPSPKPADGGAAVGARGQHVGDGIHQDYPLLRGRCESAFFRFVCLLA